MCVGEGAKTRQFHDEIYEAFDPPAQEIKIIKHRFYVCVCVQLAHLAI